MRYIQTTMKISLRNAAIVGSLLALLPIPSPAGAAAPPRYTVTDLGTLPGESSSLAVAFNDRAQVVGVCSAGGQGRAFLWEKGKIRLLPVLPGFGLLSLQPHAINNNGVVVGTDFGPDLDTRRAFIYEHGVTRDLGTPPGEYSEATGINDKNQVIGKSYTMVIKNKIQNTIDMAYTFVWDATAGFRKLNTLPNGFGEGVSAINNTGQIVGTSMSLGAEETRVKRAALAPNKRPYEGNIMPYGTLIWQDGKTRSISPPQAWSSGAVAINAQGAVLGSMSVYPDADEILTFGREESDKIMDAIHHSHHVFLWQDGETQDLGEMGHAVRVEGFNNARDVVGYGLTDDRLQYRAFLWRAGKQYMLTDLIPASSGWILDEATGINNHGQIVGTGHHNGKRRAFLLTPR